MIERFVLAGKTFGKWTVLGQGDLDKWKNRLWRVRCECGTERQVLGSNLRYGKSTSCGLCGNNEPEDKYIGKEFGRWTVIGIVGTTNGKNTVWRVRCQCGTEKEVRRDNLLSGRSKSCGCWTSELKRVTRKRNWENTPKTNRETDKHMVTGKRFGEWKAVRKVQSNKHGQAMWLMRCRCGTEREVAVKDLLSYKSTSCGCIRKYKLLTRHYEGRFTSREKEERDYCVTYGRDMMRERDERAKLRSEGKPVEPPKIDWTIKDEEVW